VGSVADALPAASPGATGHFPVPAYLPARVRPVLPWTRRHVARVAVRYQATLADLWDEAVTALLRAAVYYQPQEATTYSSDRYTKPLPDAQSFRYYAKIAVNRACWRYCLRGRRVRLVGLEEHPLEPAPSAEDEAIAREAARRAWILREHAALEAARGDHDTTSHLRAAASTAGRVARRPRRRPPHLREAPDDAPSLRRRVARAMLPRLRRRYSPGRR
jgi:hypothetical protein